MVCVHYYRADGKASIMEFIPDTLTTWRATAFAMHPRTGLGCVARPNEVSIATVWSETKVLRAYEKSKSFNCKHY